MVETGRISRANLSQQIYVSIREDLINGRYEPGRRLRITELSDEIGVSMTPVREAIFRLVSGGALVMQAATSVHVRMLKVDELNQIRLMRSLLEGEAAFHAAKRIGSDRLARLECLQEDFAAAAGDDPVKASTLNREFHFSLVEASDMPLFVDAVENLWTLIGPLLRLFHENVPTRILTSNSHKHYDVLAALREGNGDQARRAIQADIAWGKVMEEWLGSGPIEKAFSEET